MECCSDAEDSKQQGFKWTVADAVEGGLVDKPPGELDNFDLEHLLQWTQQTFRVNCQALLMQSQSIYYMKFHDRLQEVKKAEVLMILKDRMAKHTTAIRSKAEAATQQIEERKDTLQKSLEDLEKLYEDVSRLHEMSTAT